MSCVKKNTYPVVWKNEDGEVIWESEIKEKQ